MECFFFFFFYKGFTLSNKFGFSSSPETYFPYSHHIHLFSFFWRCFSTNLVCECVVCLLIGRYSALLHFNISRNFLLLPVGPPIWFGSFLTRDGNDNIKEAEKKKKQIPNSTHSMKMRVNAKREEVKQGKIVVKCYKRNNKRMLTKKLMSWINSLKHRNQRKREREKTLCIFILKRAAFSRKRNQHFCRIFLFSVRQVSANDAQKRK